MGSVRDFVGNEVINLPCDPELEYYANVFWYSKLKNYSTFELFYNKCMEEKKSKVENMFFAKE